MMRVLLVDDEPLALDRLRLGFQDIPDVDVVGSAADGIDAAQKIARLNPDLVVLDIQMPGRNGLHVAREIAEGGPRPDIVFVTAFDHFAADAFELEATDYLLKPVRFERLRAAVERVRRRRQREDAEGRAAELQALVTALREDLSRSGGAPAIEEQPFDDGIWVPGRQGAVRVPVETIDSIEAAKDYVLLNTPVKTYILRARMSDLERRLDPRLMVRAHRSNIVRIGAVTGVERPGRGALRLALVDGTSVQVGPSYIEHVTQALRL